MTESIDVARWNAAYDYWNEVLKTNTGSGYGDVLMPGGAYTTVSNAIDYFTNLYWAEGKNKEDYYRIADMLTAKGYMSGRSDINNYEQWMKLAIDTASTRYRGKYNPLEVLELLPESEFNPDGSARSFSTTSRSVAISNEGDAKATLNNAYEQMLGRRASDKELAVFQKALNDLEGRNATVTNTSGTSRTTKGNTSTSQSSKTVGGFNAGQFAQDWARSRPEYAETFAATNFMSVIDNMTRGGASLEGRVQ
jgi:hypothetical protein